MNSITPLSGHYNNMKFGVIYISTPQNTKKLNSTYKFYVFENSLIYQIILYIILCRTISVAHLIHVFSIKVGVMDRR